MGSRPRSEVVQLGRAGSRTCEDTHRDVDVHEKQKDNSWVPFPDNTHARRIDAVVVTPTRSLTMETPNAVKLPALERFPREAEEALCRN